jgi:hypothetical protein
MGANGHFGNVNSLEATHQVTAKQALTSLLAACLFSGQPAAEIGLQAFAAGAFKKKNRASRFGHMSTKLI